MLSNTVPEFDGRFRYCACCLKPIDTDKYQMGEYTYKRETSKGNEYYCGWSCMSMTEKQKKENRGRRKKEY